MCMDVCEFEPYFVYMSTAFGLAPMRVCLASSDVEDSTFELLTEKITPQICGFPSLLVIFGQGTSH